MLQILKRLIAGNDVSRLSKLQRLTEDILVGPGKPQLRGLYRRFIASYRNQSHLLAGKARNIVRNRFFRLNIIHSGKLDGARENAVSDSAGQIHGNIMIRSGKATGSVGGLVGGSETFNRTPLDPYR